MISVVVPAFNEERLLRKCLRSLKNQDFTGGFEVIVVDNGSEDNTAQIARSMGVKVIACSRKGVSYARQKGADTARGDIIVQADADTIYPRWWLCRIQKQFNSHPGTIAVAGTFRYKNPPWWAFVEYFLRTFSNLLSVLLFGRPFIISGANFAFSERAFMQIKGYDQNAYSSDQFDISTRLSKLGKIIYDMKSYGSTSKRSVVKPVVFIVLDLIRNVSYFALQMLKTSGGTLKNRGKKLDSIPTGTYIR